MEDIIIARNSYSKTSMVTGGAAFRMPANPNRIAVHMSAPPAPTSTLTISTSREDAQFNLGIYSTHYTEPAGTAIFGGINISLTLQSHGGLVMEELWVINSSGNYSVTQVILMDKFADIVRDKLRAMGV
jgi:hypothetical protein